MAEDWSMLKDVDESSVLCLLIRILFGRSSGRSAQTAALISVIFTATPNAAMGAFSHWR